MRSVVLTQEQADDLLFQVAVAALHYNRDYAVLDEGATLFADVSNVMGAVDGAALEDEDRERLRVMCGRAIDDPTGYREEFLDFVLAVIGAPAGE